MLHFACICKSILKTFKKLLKTFTIYFNHIEFCYLLFRGIYLFILCGDIALNPGSKDTKYLSLCHGNLNSIASQDFAKFSHLKSYLIPLKFSILYVYRSLT